MKSSPSSDQGYDEALMLEEEGQLAPLFNP
jgi:hypothetical protein